MSEIKNIKKHIVTGIVPDSIASELGIREGDRMTLINDMPVMDVFDYQTAIMSENLTIQFENISGEILEFEIEKDEEEDIGLIFEDYLMDKSRACKNKCIFCFIDQLPRNLRKSLYFKDDDIRLSFLSGNYITMTNVSNEELERIISFRMSPINISVHTTDPDLRIKMMNNKDAGKIMEQLRLITDANLDVNCQIVLCPQVNDGRELENTIRDLYDLGDNIRSISIVPVGLTKFRGKNELYPILPLGIHGAKSIIQTVLNWQQIFINIAGRRVIFAADEIYIKAGVRFPEISEYDDFPQLENGVGMMALFMEHMQSGIEKRKKMMNLNDISENDFANTESKKVFLITGKDAAYYISKFEEDLESIYSRKFITKKIVNNFFGENVSVAGLVTGQDIVKTLCADTDLEFCEKVIVPKCMLRSGENVFLDDMTISEMQEYLKTEILCVEPDAGSFLDELDKHYKTVEKGGSENG